MLRYVAVRLLCPEGDHLGVSVLIVSHPDTDFETKLKHNPMTYISRYTTNT